MFTAACRAALGLLCASLASADVEPEPLVEETITVVGTRTERSFEEVAATVSVTTAEDIERRLARNIADLVRFEPGVTVAGGGRFGLDGFTIRGIGGNRVLTLVDGVRVPDEFSFGPFLSARRDFVDVDSLSRAEIARGPISALYGSDALGGVVAFTTKAPQDYLDEDRHRHLELKAGHTSADDSLMAAVTAAAGGGRLSALLHFSQRQGHERDNGGNAAGAGPARERPDPQSIDTANLPAKFAFAPSNAHRFTLGFDDYRNETDTQILSDYGLSVFGATIDRRDARDARDRQRWSLAYRFTGVTAFADSVHLVGYEQRSKTEQSTLEDRTTRTRAVQTRTRDAEYKQKIRGAYAQFGKVFDLGASRHLVTYGADYYETDNLSLRDGATFDATGAPMREFHPYPTRDFPPTKVVQIGILAQDEISLFDGRLLLSPGVRFDRFDADAAPDAVYFVGNPGSPAPEDYADSEVTVKMGAVWAAGHHTSLFVRYSEGFRAPPYDDVNVGFTNFLGGYKTVSSPSLSSERSQGVEAGLRWFGDAGQMRFSAFRNTYDDFIESFAVAPAFAGSRGVDPQDGLLTFQSVNRAQVRIDGAELSALLDVARWLAGQQDVTLQAAIAWAQGRDRESGEPLNSIEPLTAVLGLGYEAPSGRWGAQLRWTLVAGKDVSEIDAAETRIPTSGYGIVDLLGHVRLTDRIRLNLGLFNLADRTYLRWADTAAIGQDAPTRFTQPGFHAGVTLRAEL